MERLLFIFIFASPIFLPTPVFPESSWSTDSFWDKGKAEISIFDAILLREGSLRKGEVVQVLVKEDHLPGLDVKADNWHQAGLIPRIKFNEVTDVSVGTYSYHQMLSIFFNRSDLEIPKIVFTSQEWCGQTYKELRLNPAKSSLAFSSYWDKEGTGEKEISLPKGAIPYNALPVLLRSHLLDKEKTLQLTLFSDLVSNKVGKLQAFEAKATFKGFNVVVEWKDGGRTGRDHFLFSKDKLNPLIRWDRADGGSYQLRKRIENDYWKPK